MGWRHGKLALYASASTAALIQGGNNFLAEPKPDRLTLYKETREQKIALANEAMNRFMIRHGIPGLSFGITINSRQVHAGGLGLADVETGGLCTDKTIMRIASISKPITATIAALLVNEGKLCLEAPIQTYLKEYPTKKFESKEVVITSRQLLSHTGGIRHYPNPERDVNNNNESTKKPKAEFLLNEEYPTVTDALEIFKNDPLIAKPGTKYSYTTHGFTVVSAILEAVSGKTFPQLTAELFKKLGMLHTSLDRNARLTFNRTRYYYRNESHQLENCPEVNNSCKWAGGGIQSCVGDLLKFANAILYSYQCPENGSTVTPLLPRKILDDFWKGEIRTSELKDIFAGLGWFRYEGNGSIGGLRENHTIFYHTGGAVGASSVLLIAPEGGLDENGMPQGICIAVLSNLQGVEMSALGIELKEIFEDF